MKKIGLIIKEASESRIKNSLKDNNSFIIIKYAKIKSPDMSQLRQSLKNAKADLFVVKNTVARRVLKSTEYESLTGFVDGPCGFIFLKEEPVSASKVLYEFLKDHQDLKLEGGFLKDRVLTSKDIESLAKLPSADVLRAKVVYSLKSPISGLVMVLSGTLRKLVVCLDQIKNKKG
ncbi:MAG: 50S ribosomal protein L10 [Candidatus Omnitrophota bacterium]|jgi:large subunit ribosomal protein L10|nr:MAG: 50S ribosomal protein L10 [Candidatus Omnitrophota bacterium]